jgi:hypothetical protein
VSRYCVRPVSAPPLWQPQRSAFNPRKRDGVQRESRAGNCHSQNGPSDPRRRVGLTGHHGDQTNQPAPTVAIGTSTTAKKMTGTAWRSVPAKPLYEGYGERPGRERGHPEPECERAFLRFVAHAVTFAGLAWEFSPRSQSQPIPKRISRWRSPRPGPAECASFGSRCSTRRLPQRLQLQPVPKVASLFFAHAVIPSFLPRIEPRAEPLPAVA